MKILYHHRIKSKDGQYVHIEELVTALRRLGNEVVISGPGDVVEGDFGGESRLVGALKRLLPGALYELLEFAYSIPDAFRLFVHCVRFRPDFIYERYNLYFLSGIWVSRFLRIPLVLEVNAPLYEERSRYGGLSLGRLAIYTQKSAWQGADAIITVTGVLKEKVLEYGVDPDRIHVIPNGIDPERFRGYARPDNDENGDVVIGFVGFIREWHRVDRLIRYVAARKSLPIRLLVVGDGPALPELKRLAHQEGVLDRVEFMGLVGRDAIPEALSRFDIAVQSDVVEYASPLKMFEYMALGKPIVAPDKRNIREVVNEECAVFFQADEEGSIEQALDRLVSDRELRRKLGSNARRRVLDHGYTWEANARRTLEIAKRITD